MVSISMAAVEAEESEAAASPMEMLPIDAIHHILSRLPLRPALACRSSCRFLRDALAAPPFPGELPLLPLLALRHPRPSPSLIALDPSSLQWLHLPLSFLPPSPLPVASSPSLLYLWIHTSPSPDQPKSLIVCNPLARSYRVLPPLGSAWSRHGTVLAAPGGAALVLTELAALSYAPGADRWRKHPLHLPSKPRSPLLLPCGVVLALCDVGSPWRSQWKLFSSSLSGLGSWVPLERHEWLDVFDILRRPRLVEGAGGARVLMIGGLRASFAIDAPCSTILILRLELKTMEWDEAGRMPTEMYRCFAAGSGTTAMGGVVGTNTNNKVKVFGGNGRVWFAGKRVRGKLVMWEEEEVGNGGGAWRWVKGVPGNSEGVYQGFVFEAGFTVMP